MASRFIPRSSFPDLPHLPRSYFLGHHKTALEKLKTVVKDTDIVIELRDYRVPLTSINPQFESALTGLRRWIVYSKVDLGRYRTGTPQADGTDYEKTLRHWHHRNNADVFFNGLYPPFANGVSSIIKSLKAVQEDAAKAGTNLTGIRLLVVGMPNIGKSTLINALHARSVRNVDAATRRAGKIRKVARTEMGPGTTRAFSEYIKVLEAGTEKLPEYAFAKPAVYLRDTPGVFVPYVPDSEAMLKLALVGCIKQNVIPEMVLADYLLFRLNLYNPEVYASFCPPTNEVAELCMAYARKRGRVGKGGHPVLEWAAEALVKDFQRGSLARFVLDEVSEQSLQDYEDRERNNPAMSMRQLRRIDKEMKLEHKKQKYLSL